VLVASAIATGRSPREPKITLNRPTQRSVDGEPATAGLRYALDQRHERLMESRGYIMAFSS
jgi:hypothetical protein